MKIFFERFQSKVNYVFYRVEVDTKKTIPPRVWQKVGHQKSLRRGSSQRANICSLRSLPLRHVADDSSVTDSTYVPITEIH